MTYNEFKLCSILFFKKFKGRNIEDVVQTIEGWKPVKGKIEELIFVNGETPCAYLNNEKKACLFYSVDEHFRIEGYSSRPFKNIECFETVEDVLETFKIDLEDIV